MPLPRRVLWYGKDAPLPEARELRAGPLTMLLEEGGLRYVRLDKVEVLRQVYGAVRDRDWNTVPAEVSNLAVDQRESSFEASFDVLCRDVDFLWRGTIRGSADGTIVFRFEGEARATFLRNRIGLCVLHPVSCAARPCRVTHSDGSIVEGVFPRLVSPHQPFKDVAAISHPVAAGCEAEVRFEGEVFEMEDQRNWTDASFKTYSTPLALPFPVEVKAGTRIVQTVTLSIKGSASLPPRDSRPLGLTIGKSLGAACGLGLGASAVELTPKEAARLRALRLGHLRVDVDMSRPSWETTLAAASKEARAIDVRLHVGVRSGAEAARARRPDVDRVLVLDPKDPRDAANADIVGTRAYFAELNRSFIFGLRTTPVVYSINPQVHGSDLRTLVETLEGQEETLHSAKARCDRGVFVGPVTLKPRFNPNATSADKDVESALPASVDERQMSLFGAAWTVGSLRRLSGQGIHALTYYETVGWRGLMEREAGSPAHFPSIPGGVFPLYHVFADLAGRSDVLTCAPTDPLRAEIFAFTVDGLPRALAANLTPEPLRVRLAGLPDRLRVRRLNETNAERAMRSPEDYRAEAPEVLDGDVLDLLPFEIARLDA